MHLKLIHLRLIQYNEKKAGMDSKSWHSHLKRKLNFVGIKTHSISLHPMPFILYISLSNLALFGLFSLESQPTQSQPTHCISLSNPPPSLFFILIISVYLSTYHPLSLNLYSNPCTAPNPCTTLLVQRYFDHFLLKKITSI